MIPINKHIHPATNNNPPTGVMIPMPFRPTVLVAFNAVKIYRDPENKTMPSMNNHPALNSHLPGNVPNKTATANKANV